MAHTFSPFANELDAIKIGDLDIENRLDRVTIYGSIDLTKDKEGLKNAMALKSIIDKVVDALRVDSLPDKVPVTTAKMVSNPFQK